MQIIPAIDIRNGKCVRLTQGDYTKEKIYNYDPLRVAEEWKRQGAKMLHIVDLDGAKVGETANFSSIKKIIQITQLPVQVGGGIRTLETAKKYIEVGAQWIILGTSALQDEIFMQKITRMYVKKITVSLDMKGDSLMQNGWLEKSDKRIKEVIQNLDSMGIKRYIYTDTTRDGTLTEPNYKGVADILAQTQGEVLVAGGVSSVEHIQKLQKMGAEGVILGKALYENIISFRDLLNINKKNVS